MRLDLKLSEHQIETVTPQERDVLLDPSLPRGFRLSRRPFVRQTDACQIRQWVVTWWLHMVVTYGCYVG